MAERETLGQILLEVGRIGEADVERALEHQRSHGGYFGEALVALGLVSAEELEWGLASQYDLPYVFPDPEAVDPDAAETVSPEWALTHLTMPILKSGDTLTVVVDSPLRTAPVDELSRRTGFEVAMALASPTQIRELIRQVYARATAREEVETPMPCSLREALALAGEAKAARFGISVRGRRAGFWYDDAGTVRRRTLDERWEEALDEVLDPSPSSRIPDEERAVFQGELTRQGNVTPVDVRFMADDAGREYLFRPRREDEAPHHRFTPPSQGVLTEVQLLARSGSARFIFSADPPKLAHEVLPHLPVLFFEPSWRSIHIHGADAPPSQEAFSVEMPGNEAQWASDLEGLRAFHFDVVTVDLRGHPEAWVGGALDVASVAFVLWETDQDPAAAREAGIRWRLEVSRQEGDHLEWSLSAL